jgi:hypothetical protein
MIKCKACGSGNVIYDDESQIKFTFFFCRDCKLFETTELNCDHDFRLVVREIKGGSRKVSKFCRMCYRVEDGGKLKDVPPNTPRVSYDRWTSFFSNLNNHEESNGIQYQYAANLFFSNKYDIDPKYIYQINREKIERETAYEEYLNSQEWKDKRAAAKKRDNNECQICGQTNDLCVHHLTYTHVEYDPEKKRVEGREFLFELVTLCNECHISHYHPHKL